MILRIAIALLTLTMVSCETTKVKKQPRDLAGINKLRRQTPDKPIEIRQLHDDSLSTSFIIWIEEEVKPHYHLNHAEHVYVLDGEGIMTINSEDRPIVAGDMILMAPGDTHSVQVTSVKELKVLSIQSPRFTGKDRVWVDAAD